MQQAYDDVLQVFNAHSSFLLTTHVNPDGDGIGSELALARWLSEKGKTVRILNHDATPAVYRFLDPSGVIGRYDGERHDADVANVQVIVVLDTNHPGRLRSLQRLVNESSAAKVCIDHHLDPDPFADNYLIDADATSTGEILYRLFMRSGSQRLPPGIAEPLYCAIMTDTGSFRYPRVDPDIHRIAAELIGWGADPVAVYSGVYERWSTGRIHLLGETLAGLRTEASGKLAHVTISREMLSRTSTVEDDTDNFTVYPMSVDGVVLGILFLELDGAVKISFRSKGEIPVNLLAGEFGGGGHKNAAGAHVQEGTLDSVKMRVIAAAAKYVPAAR